MADSDDESSAQRREKFQRERDPRNEQFERRVRDRDWNQRDRSHGWNGQSTGMNTEMKSMQRPPLGGPSEPPRRRPIDYPPHMDMKRRYSPDHDADMRGRKRIRGAEHAMNWARPIRTGYEPRVELGHMINPHPIPVEDEINSSSMLPFKKWLLLQNDDITDQEAVENYAKYKINFRRQQLQDFFIAHKHEEWFQQKYHPDLSKKCLEEQRERVKKRVQVYKRLEELGFFKSTRLDLVNETAIIKLMDSAVILMEGGDEEDIKSLDDPHLEEGEEETRKSADVEASKSTEDAAKDEENKEQLEKDAVSSVEDASKEQQVTEDKEVKKPRVLHKTHSIFMRNLTANITKQEIVNLCKKFPGFIRVATSLQDSIRFMRRCWVSFNRGVNIKKICWELNKIRIHENEEISAVVNRDLTRRVRAVSGISLHTSCARHDLRNIARLIAHLDTKWDLWDEVGGENPWMKDISEYLVDEKNAEEEELLGDGVEKDAESQVVEITPDEDLIAIVDRLLYYLRVVHSVDYYNASEYPCEDEMPNRCGIIHARGPIPPNSLTNKDIEDFQKRFNDKLVNILNFKSKLSDEEAKKLGPKDEDVEVEKFITSNTQEIETNKWLCPLSGKKFKGREYIRKHIMNKYMDKVDAVRSEVQFFNNYLMDPRRPGPPAKPNQPRSQPTTPNVPQSSPYAVNRGYAPPGISPQFRGRSQFVSPPYYQRPPGGYGNGRSHSAKNVREMRHNSSGGDFRSRNRIAYQDLDAPEVDDFF